MADVTIFDVNGGGNDAELTASITVGAVSQEVPCENGKDSRLVLRVQNDNAANEAVVCIASGDGVRSGLGDLSVEVAAVSTAYIALFDTARYKDLSGDDISITLVDDAGVALESGELANVVIEAVQL